MHFYKKYLTTTYGVGDQIIPESSDHTAIQVYFHILKKVAEIFQHLESNSVSSSQYRDMLFDPGCLHTLQ